MLHHKKNWSRAFTLIEVLVTTALSVILLLVIVQLYVVYGRTIIFHQTSLDVALGGSTIMDAARMAGSQAKSVIATHSFSGVSYNSGTTTVIFELPAVDASGAIITSAYDYIGIYASSSNAYRIIDAAPGSVRVSSEKRLTGVLDALSFTYNSPLFPSVTNITINATTSATIRGEMTQTHLRGHIYLQNI
jgi:prepilin-type N-terminal cleavage/methylation domain-containing protein